jgi:hypothetical protein
MKWQGGCEMPWLDGREARIIEVLHCYWGNTSVQLKRMAGRNSFGRRAGQDFRSIPCDFEEFADVQLRFKIVKKMDVSCVNGFV